MGNVDWRLAGLAALFLAGCPAPVPTTPATTPGGNASLGGHIKRGMEKPKVQNALDQLGKFYQLYNTETGRSPASWDEFKAYIQKDAPKIVEAVDQGVYGIVWNARLGSDVVIAYEKEPDLRGNQIVVLGDGHIEPMSPSQLQTALQRK